MSPSDKDKFDTTNQTNPSKVVRLNIPKTHQENRTDEPKIKDLHSRYTQKTNPLHEDMLHFVKDIGNTKKDPLKIWGDQDIKH